MVGTYLYGSIAGSGNTTIDITSMIIKPDESFDYNTNKIALYDTLIAVI